MSMSTDDDDSGPILLSCGSLIIDDIVYEDGTEQKDVLGGAGVFAIYGTISMLSYHWHFKLVMFTYVYYLV